MDWFVIIGILALGGVFVGFTAYSMVTKSIIKQQEREIVILRNEIRRLKAEIKGMKTVRTSEAPRVEPHIVSYRRFFDIE